MPADTHAAGAAKEPAGFQQTGFQQPGFLARHAATLASALGTLLLAALIGGAAVWLLTERFTRSVEAGAGTEVAAIGVSVANALAQQFERAANYGIALDKLRDVAPYLAETAREVPGVARIVVRLADGREIRSDADPAGNGDDSRETVFAPLIFGGSNLGQIEVLTDGDELTGALDRIPVLALYATGLISLIAALAAAVLVGRPLDRRRAELLAHLRRNAEGRFGTEPVPRPKGHDRVAGAFDALRAGEARILEKRSAVDAYAEELLGVDFDGVLRARIQNATQELH